MGVIQFFNNYNQFVLKMMNGLITQE